MRRFRWTMVVGLSVLGLAVAACASISKKYESDVRFERCYALDWKKDVDTSIRSHCWEDWLAYYSKDQTRDRIEYAKGQSGGVGAPVATPLGSASAQSSVGGAVPNPTSVFTPVPMMASSSGSASARLSASGSASNTERSACEGRCDHSLEACLSGCGSGVCEQFCAQKHGRCTSKCK